MAEMSKKDSVIQAIKFALFSASAGVIQVLSFTLLNELIVPNINIDNEKVMKILSSDYGVCYLIALILSVIWNFTFNRKYTFKSATNVPIAMLKVFGFYCVFTPVSTILGELFSRVFTADYAEYIILGVTMLANMITEFLFCKKVVYKDSMNTLGKDDDEDDEDEEKDDEEKTEEEKKAEREAEKEAEKDEKEAIQKAKKKARKQEKKRRKKAKKKAKKAEKKAEKKAKKKAEKKAAKDAKKEAKKDARKAVKAAEKAAKKAAKESEE